MAKYQFPKSKSQLIKVARTTRQLGVDLAYIQVESNEKLAMLTQLTLLCGGVVSIPVAQFELLRENLLSRKVALAIRKDKIENQDCYILEVLQAVLPESKEDMSDSIKEQIIDGTTATDL